VYNKIEVKKPQQAPQAKKAVNKSISKERIVSINQFRNDKAKAVKALQDKTTSTQKNNSYYLKKSELLGKAKGNFDSKINENNRKLSYDNKAK
jgi:hypothetical protein